MFERYELTRVQFSGAGGPEAIPNATVSLKKGDGETVTDAAPGVTVIQAVYNAIERIVGISPMVVEWNATGRDVVKLALHEDGIHAIGVGSDQDIVVASARAFVDAINHLLGQRSQRQAEVPATA